LAISGWIGFGKHPKDPFCALQEDDRTKEQIRFNTEVLKLIIVGIAASGGVLSLVVTRGSTVVENLLTGWYYFLKKNNGPDQRDVGKKAETAPLFHRSRPAAR
jgi:hypothetical protein